MNELGNIFKAGWTSSGAEIPPPADTGFLISEANRLNQESMKFQRNTVLVLGSTFLMMAYILLGYFKFQDILSHIGVRMMLSFFFLRVILEIYSIIKGKSGSISDSAADSLKKENDYLQLRLRIHSTFTYLTLGAYTLGFFLLLPEFSKHMSKLWLSAVVASYLIPGWILTLLIRKNVQKELRDLRMVVKLKKQIED